MTQFQQKQRPVYTLCAFPQTNRFITHLKSTAGADNEMVNCKTTQQLGVTKVSNKQKKGDYLGINGK